MRPVLGSGRLLGARALSTSSLEAMEALELVGEEERRKNLKGLASLDRNRVGQLSIFISKCLRKSGSV